MLGCARNQFDEVQAELNGSKAPVKTPVDTPPREPDQIDLPSGDVDQQWDIGVAPQEPAFNPAALEQHLPEKFSIWGAAVAPQAGKAVITYMDTKDRDAKTTHAAFIDLARGAVTVKFQAPDMIAPYAMSPSGRHALFCRKDGVLSRRETLYLATVRDDGRVGLKMWRPLADEFAKEVELYVKEQEIIWTSFVGAGHIVTLNRTGKLHIWNLHTLNREGVFPGVKGYPTVTPDGRQVAFITGDVAVLLDPAQGAVTGVHRATGLPRDPVLAFHPRGRYLAAAGKGKCTVMDVTTGYSTGTQVDRLRTDPGMSLKPDFGWAGRFLYANGQLFDFDSSVAVWAFNGGEANMLHGDYLWAVVRGHRKRNGKREVVLRRFSVPLRHIENEVASMLSSNTALLLKPGDPVQIDVEDIPPDHQKQAYRDLSENLTRHGFVPSSHADVIMRAYVDRNAVRRKTQYKELGGKKAYTLEYEERKAHMELVQHNKVRWSDSRSNTPPYFLRKIPGDSFLTKYGGPDYEMFAKSRLPKFLRNSRHSVGRTYYRIDGFRLSK